MNQEELTKELNKHLKEGESASDILKRIKAEKEKKKQAQQQPAGGIPTPPPPPKKSLWDTTPTEQEKPQQSQPQTDKDEIIDSLKDANKKLSEDVKFWNRTANNYLTSLRLLTAENDRLKTSNATLKRENEQLKERQKLSILEPSRPQPRNMPNSPRDLKIIEQVKGHLEPLTNSTTLKGRILEAEKENSLNAYWDLQTDLREPGEIQKKLIKYFSQNIDNATAYVYEMAKILRGEYINEN